MKTVFFCNIRVTKITFELRLNIGFRELQKKPDIYDFFSYLVDLINGYKNQDVVFVFQNVNQ